MRRSCDEKGPLPKCRLQRSKQLQLRRQRRGRTVSRVNAKGVAMKRFACLLTALLGVCLAANEARADWGSAHYGGYQPWWNIFAKRNPYMSIEEERLQRFWHDYYDALRRYYGMLDRIDWVAYYKNHGYQINTGYGCGPGGGSSRVQFAPVFV